MRKAMLVAAVGVLALLAGCGTTTTSNKPIKPTGGAAKPSVATVGDTLSITGNDNKLEVTLQATKRAAPVTVYGTQMSPAAFAVELRVKNVSGKVYDDSITNCVTVIDSKNESHDAEMTEVTKNGGPVPGQLDSVKISAGDVRSGWVFFAMKPTQKPRMLQFTADSGFGPEVGEWSLK